ASAPSPFPTIVWFSNAIASEVPCEAAVPVVVRSATLEPIAAELPAAAPVVVTVLTTEALALEPPAAEPVPLTVFTNTPEASERPAEAPRPPAWRRTLALPLDAAAALPEPGTAF